MVPRASYKKWIFQAKEKMWKMGEESSRWSHLDEGGDMKRGYETPTVVFLKTLQAPWGRRWTGRGKTGNKIALAGDGPELRLSPLAK